MIKQLITNTYLDIMKKTILKVYMQSLKIKHQVKIIMVNLQVMNIILIQKIIKVEKLKLLLVVMLSLFFTYILKKIILKSALVLLKINYYLLLILNINKNGKSMLIKMVVYISMINITMPFTGKKTNINIKTLKKAFM